MRKAFVVLGAIVIVAAFAPTAAPDQPMTFSFAFSQTAPLVGTCPFEITVDSIVSGRGTVLTYKSGARKEQYHINEQDRFSANGKSLSGVPFTFNATWTYDSNGNLASVVTNGVAERVPLPDGTVFHAAGRTDFVAQGMPAFILTPDHGATVNLEGFCAALAP